MAKVAQPVERRMALKRKICDRHLHVFLFYKKVFFGPVLTLS